MTANREWVFKARPGAEGFKPDESFELRDCDGSSDIKDGEVVVATRLMSVDPTLRNAMAGADAAERTDGSYYYSFMNWQPGSVPSWGMVAEVLESKADALEKGDFVFGFLPWRQQSVVDAESAKKLEKIPDGRTPQAHISCLGLTGQTGFLGAKFILKPQEGQVAYVSGAAGSTGMAALETLRNLGCTVVGSAGSDEKVALVESLGCKCFNYKTESPNVGLKRLCPDGIDLAFDNVGGEGLEAILEMMNDGGSIALCGAISQYDKPPAQKYGIKNTFHLVAKRIRMEGFLVFQFSTDEQAECKETLAKWHAEGKLNDHCTIVDGFDNLITGGLQGLFSGANIGKLLVRMAPLN